MIQFDLMETDSKKVELLAPAGNFKALKSAIINGADAVYLGLNSFSARDSAENFSIESLKEAVDFAHLFNAKIYLTINTLLKDSEIEEAVTLANKAWNCGVSAIIVQDLGFVKRLREINQEIVLHASTQMAIHNLYGAITAQKMGLERVILSRETPLSEIKNISKNCDIELEYFVHGALCCCFSGNCYLSSLVAKRSGNRGKCLQLCRKPYLIKDRGKNEKGYWLSTRDTMLINHLKDLQNAGISSFKIEGRMKRPEYVGEVTRIYKKAINEEMIDESDPNNLRLMFNRGNFSKAHIDGIDSNIIYPKLQSHMGIKLGNVKNIFKGKAVLDCFLNKGDGIKFLREGREVGHALVLNDGNETGFVGNIQKGDQAHLTDSAKYNAQINSRTAKIPIKIAVDISLEKGLFAISVNWGDRNKKEFIYSARLEKAKNNPVTYEEIRQCFISLGGTDYECKEFNLKKDQEFFATKAVLKGVRRQLIDDFEKHLIKSFNRSSAKNNSSIGDFLNNLKPLSLGDSCTIIMCNTNDIKEYEKFADYIAIKPDNYLDLYNDIKAGKFIKNKDKYLLDLPAIALGDDLNLLQEIIDSNTFDKYIVNNAYGLTLARGQILLGYKMNILNHIIDFPKVASIESPLITKDSTEIAYVFGYPDLMQTVHCYYKLRRGCDKCKKEGNNLQLVDDRGEIYTIKKQKIVNCYNLISGLKIDFFYRKECKRRFIDLTNIDSNIKKQILNVQFR